MENIGLERGTGQGRRHPWRSVHLSREPCLEQGLPSPKTRSSSRPPPKNPRDQTRRKVQFLSSSSSSFLLSLPLSRPPSSCLFACLFADSDHWAFLGETVPCRVSSNLSPGLVEKKKEIKERKKNFIFERVGTRIKLSYSLSLSLLIFCLVRGSMIYIKIVLYDVGK